MECVCTVRRQKVISNKDISALFFSDWSARIINTGLIAAPEAAHRMLNNRKGRTSRMNLIERLRSDWIYVTGYARIIAAAQGIKPESMVLVGDEIERLTSQHASRDFIVFDDEHITYEAFDRRANQFAHWGLKQGLRPGDCVCLFMENRPDYIAFWAGMAKIAVKTALINSNLTGPGLAHCIRVAGAKALVLNGELADAYETARSDVPLDLGAWSLGEAPNAKLLDAELAGMPQTRPDRSVRAGIKAAEVALYIYTSGTTGLPKAARITNVRARGLMRVFVEAVGVNENDRILLTLPLYHATGGMCGVGCALYTGGTLILRKKFSATHFWQEAVDSRATMFVYIGELGRYLMNQPPSPMEKTHRMVKGFGNGLRADVWAEMVERTGIGHLVEFYGSTEGNVNFFNMDGKIGSVGRVPPILRGLIQARIVRFDIETNEPLRGMDGLCIEAAPDESGEAIGPITQSTRQRFDGYDDPKQTARKVLTDVFEKGDKWFRTGDLMRRDRDGYFYFVDRIGDTFRWKSENVSTTEVEMALSGFPGVKHAVVYGVAAPGFEGRAGMAALVIEGPVDFASLGRHLARSLPTYARPVFLRLMQGDAETTGTFKYRKIELAAVGFDPSRTSDPMYVMDPDIGSYTAIDAEEFAKVMSGRMRL
jgi:fatty-acyl-CoA synthase